MNSTSLRITTIVVMAIAVLAALAVGSLAWCMIMGIDSNQVLLTAFVGITSGLVGALTGLLVNTRTPHTADDEPSTINANITNPVSDPVNMTDVKP